MQLRHLAALTTRHVGLFLSEMAATRMAWMAEEQRLSREEGVAKGDFGSKLLKNGVLVLGKS